MSIGESPPQRPPMLSPDGKWVWSGTEWLPIAGHGAVFAAWNSIRVDPVETAPQVAQPVAAPAPMPAPVMQYAPVQPDVEAVPLWQEQRSTGLNKYLYIVAGVIAIVVAVVAVNSLGIQFPWSVSAPEGPSRNTFVPPPVAVRSDAGRADNVLAGLLAPPMLALGQDVEIVKETCYGTLTEACQNAVTAADNQVKSVLATIDHATIPVCIATNMTKLRVDVASMDDALQLAIKGYKDSQGPEVTQGVSRLVAPAQRAQADAAAGTTQKAKCDTQHTGP